jgi:hypothetical protein
MAFFRYGFLSTRSYWDNFTLKNQSVFWLKSHFQLWSKFFQFFERCFSSHKGRVKCYKSERILFGTMFEKFGFKMPMWTSNFYSCFGKPYTKFETAAEKISMPPAQGTQNVKSWSVSHFCTPLTDDYAFLINFCSERNNFCSTNFWNFDCIYRHASDPEIEQVPNSWIKEITSPLNFLQYFRSRKDSLFDESFEIKT